MHEYPHSRGALASTSGQRVDLTIVPGRSHTGTRASTTAPEPRIATTGLDAEAAAVRGPPRSSWSGGVLFSAMSVRLDQSGCVASRSKYDRC